MFRLQVIKRLAVPIIAWVFATLCFCYHCDALTTRPGGKTASFFHLFSLRFTTEDERFSKVVQDTWRWKDAALGDGRDFFVPRPQTLKALQSFLLDENDAVVVISNCARFEILVQTNEANASQLALKLSERLLQQQECYKSEVTMFQRLFAMDQPSIISASCKTRSIDGEQIKELSRHWTCFSGVRDILEHLCLVSAGMALRPRRGTSREVVFRPFSSRDAHILLQLKRTAELANSGNIAFLLRTALQAGKAARNPDVVPELVAFRKDYGTGDSSKYSSEPPRQIMLQVMEAAKGQAIDPIIESAYDDYVASKRSNVIQSFRTRVLALHTSRNDLQFLKRELHEPTMKLRRDENFDQETAIVEIKERLENRRRAA